MPNDIKPITAEDENEFLEALAAARSAKEEAPQEEKPKKRGRKPKVAPEAEAVPTAAAPAATPAKEEETPQEEAPKKRGRKPKVAPEAPAPAPAPAPEEDAVDEDAEPCPICLDKYTAVLRKPIACPSCQADTCAQCVKRYLVSTTDDPHCPHCKHGFDRMFLQTNLSKLYMNTTYAEHRAQILWRREESFLPATQVKAERVRRGYKYNEEVIKPLEEARRKLQKQIVELHTQAEQISGEIRWHYDDRQRLLRGDMTRAEAREAGATVEDSTKSRRAFARKCTAEGCHGWLSSAWKCGLCDNYTCPDCFIIKGKQHDVEHTCKKDDLETATLIRASSKPCPKCGEGIEKREGCDMMFCTSCHTPFSWKTLEIITRGSVHNPHYFEWRNRVGAGAAGAAHGAEPLPCGGMPNDTFIYRTCSVIGAATSTNASIGGTRAVTPTGTQDYIFSFEMREELARRFRTTSHIEGVVAQQYNNHTVVQNTEYYRIRYLLHEMGKTAIQEILQNDERTRERHKAIRDVLDTYLVAAAEQFRIVAANPTPEVATATMEQLDQLRDFINECLRNVHRTYGCTVPIILNDWSDTDTYTATKEKERQRVEAREAADAELVEWKRQYAAMRKEVAKVRAIVTLRGRERDFYRTPEYTKLQNEIYAKDRETWTVNSKIVTRQTKYADEDAAAKQKAREARAAKQVAAATATATNTTA